jgi:PLP dependent protein
MLAFGRTQGKAGPKLPLRAAPAYVRLLGDMGTSRQKLAANLAAVRRRIAEACKRAHRQPEDVRLVAVTKTADDDVLRDLVVLGQLDLAESRVQQLTERAAALQVWLAKQPPDRAKPRWHMVGHLQRNKVKACLTAAEVIHSVDTLRLAEEINVRADRAGRVIDCLMEVNCGNESQKEGVAVGAAAHLAEQISTLRNVRLIGLMTMAPRVPDPRDARFAFARLRELFDEMRNDKIGGKHLNHLSMGMSDDFEVAVEEGATMVRIGSALFE